ncbi:Uncharacterised protein [BD1-7 clade bacterium]|uniref:DUF1835 domain-containing protein n=1 Tax=BD1-7 clade bacterium TaxID=2029982 RepID=A0A5S9QXE3_9GAMM|nr:Uncharacterised protein [BD1-7 clade bacterium]
MTCLHITNGDAAADLIRQAQIDGQIMPWRDVLHEGPVPAGLEIRALRSLRMQFIAAAGWASGDLLAEHLKAFNAVLDAIEAQQFSEIVLWFEHDLYDQLQLIEVLDMLATLFDGPLTLVQTDTFLTSFSATDYPALFDARETVSEAQQALAQQVWQAFRAPTMDPIIECLNCDLSVLPHLYASLLRWCEEFPNPETGLSRTQTVILTQLAEQSSEAGRLFRRYQQQEEARFMGDTVFFWIVQRLVDAGVVAAAPTAAITGETTLSITALGENILNRRCYLQQITPLDTWRGGMYFR